MQIFKHPILVILVLACVALGGCAAFYDQVRAIDKETGKGLNQDLKGGTTVLTHFNPVAMKTTDAPWRDPATGVDRQTAVDPTTGIPNLPNDKLPEAVKAEPKPWLSGLTDLLGDAGPFGWLFKAAGAALVAGAGGYATNYFNKRKLEGVVEESDTKIDLLGSALMLLVRVAKDVAGGKLDTDKDGKVSTDELRIYVVSIAQEYLVDAGLISGIVTIATSKLSSVEQQAAVAELVAKNAAA